ncbi:kinase-like domain-containing protein [Tricladium varicosporioides]|nr:kinase-like domain-containing protein [Hymenoscyphus varicosporioides]
MGDAGPSEDGWHLVSAHPALEVKEAQQIEKWSQAPNSWSGKGKHLIQWAEHKSVKVAGHHLGVGSYGLVERVTYGAVTMARKHVMPRRGVKIEKLREEANVMERLAHKHILKLVGTYTLRRNDLFLLLYPACVCDLSKFLDDVEDIRAETDSSPENRQCRVRALGLDLEDIGTIEDLAILRQPSSKGESIPRAKTAVGFLQQVLGCTTEALAYVHSQDIRHRDLKPKNILLSPGRIYLADFGIARDVRECENSLTCKREGTPSFIAPEVYEEMDHHMSPADVWALGGVFLNIVAVLYGADLERYDQVMKERDWDKKYVMLPKYLEDLRDRATKAALLDCELPNFNSKHVIRLIDSMLKMEPNERPSATEVNAKLSELGGLDQVYHLPCCHKNNRIITEVINNKLKAAAEENSHVVLELRRLKAENDMMKSRLAVLEEHQNTWEERLAKERNHAGDQYKKLQEKYNHEVEARKKLEEKSKYVENKPFRQRPRSQTRGRGRSQGVLHPNGGSAPIPYTNNRGFRTQGAGPEIAMNAQRRTSGIPLPSRPTTPLRPAMNREPGSNESTLTNSRHSIFSLPDESFSSASSAGSGTIRSSSPGSPTAAQLNTSSTVHLARTRFSGSSGLASGVTKPEIAERKPTHQAKPSWANIARSSSAVS